jgi:hypothetical protein
MAYNNTYGLRLINETQYKAAKHEWEKPDGCKAQLEECRQLSAKYDPEQIAISSKVNKACLKAQATCAVLFSLNGPSNVGR